MEELFVGESAFGLHRTEHVPAGCTLRKTDDCDGRVLG